MSSFEQEEVVRRAYEYRQALVCYSFAILKDWALAEDAVQETLISVHMKWDSYKPGTQFGNWLKRIAYNKSIDIIRKRKREVSTEESEILDILDIHFNNSLNEESLEVLKEKKNALYECMQDLPPSSLNLILKFYHQKIPCDKIGESMNKSGNSVRLMLTRIRKKLRKCCELRMKENEIK